MENTPNHMPVSSFRSNLESTAILIPESIALLEALCHESSIPKNSSLLTAGSIPKHYYYVVKGLFAYYFLTDNGEKVIKKFFPENTFIASASALLTQTPGHFSIEALEDSVVLSIPADRFKALVAERHDIALFYINYLEKNWVIEKEMLEISSKSDDAKVRYATFLTSYATILPRLKQHHIASFLGITPTQLSRIKPKP